MIVSTRSLRRAGIGAGLALALVIPTTGVANAAPASSSHATVVSPTVKQAALVALRAALAKAAADQRAAVAAARLAFDTDGVVVLAKSQRLAIINSSTDAAVILAANVAYADAVSGPAATRAGAIDNARTARFAAVDAAYAAYDLIVNPANAIARNALRAAMRSANYELRTHVVAAHKAFRMSTASAHATQRAAINTAIAVFTASGRTPADLAVFNHSIAAARKAFAATPAVVAARAARHTAVHTAWVRYALDVRAARIAFHKATGHWPHVQRIVPPAI